MNHILSVLIPCIIREIVLQVTVLLQFQLLLIDCVEADMVNFRNSYHLNHHLVVMIRIIVVEEVV